MHHRGDEDPYCAVLGYRRAEQGRRRGAHVVVAVEPEPHEASFGLVGDTVAAELHDHGPAGRDLTRRVDGCFRCLDDALVEHGHAGRSEDAFRFVLGQGARNGLGHTAVARSRQNSSRRTRFRSLPASVLGSSSRSSYRRGRLYPATRASTNTRSSVRSIVSSAFAWTTA